MTTSRDPFTPPRSRRFASGQEWLESIERPDWAAATRMHESAHVTASEALGMPIATVWTNPDRDVAHGGQYDQEPKIVDGQQLAVVCAIGAEGGAHELLQRGYDQETSDLFSIYTGRDDRNGILDRIIPGVAQAGQRVDADIAYDTARQMLVSKGFQDAAHNVAQALEDQGDRLTGADVRAALGSFELDKDLWVPTSFDPLPSPAEHEIDHDDDIDL